MLGIGLRPLVVVGALVAAGAIYLYTGGKPLEGATPLSGTSKCQFQVTADILNVRTGPGADQPVVGKYRKDAVASGTAEQQNGFRKLGDKRWAAGDFLIAVQGSSCP